MKNTGTNYETNNAINLLCMSQETQKTESLYEAGSFTHAIASELDLGNDCLQQVILIQENEDARK